MERTCRTNWGGRREEKGKCIEDTGGETKRKDVRFEVFHGSDYEECRLQGYKNPVGTSQETHHVSTTELRPLMLCKI
jgi:hypothetical protein